MKAVFFISQPLRGIVIETLKDIIRSSKFQYITIVTNLNPSCYGENSESYFDDIRDKCLIWMENAVSFIITFQPMPNQSTNYKFYSFQELHMRYVL